MKLQHPSDSYKSCLAALTIKSLLLFTSTFLILCLHFLTIKGYICFILCLYRLSNISILKIQNELLLKPQGSLTNLVWEYPSVILIIDLFVLSSNTVALKVITRSAMSRHIAACFSAHVVKFLVTQRCWT